MTNYTAQPNAPAAISATYPAQPTEFERQVFLRDRVKGRLAELYDQREMPDETKRLIADLVILEFLSGIGAADLVELRTRLGWNAAIETSMLWGK